MVRKQSVQAIIQAFWMLHNVLWPQLLAAWLEHVALHAAFPVFCMLWNARCTAVHYSNHYELHGVFLLYDIV